MYENNDQREDEIMYNDSELSREPYQTFNERLEDDRMDSSSLRNEEDLTASDDRFAQDSETFGEERYQTGANQQAESESADQEHDHKGPLDQVKEKFDQIRRNI